MAVAPVGDDAAEARRLRRIGDDDDLPLPDGAYAVPAADGSAEGPARPERTVLLCAAVRPSAPARRLGPIAGDLSGRFVGSAAGPAVHGALAALLLVSAAVGAAASDGCGAVLIAAGAAVGVHSLAVASVRPYLGLWHNATEAVFGLAAAVCLVAWGVASLTDEEGGGGAAAASECPSGVSPLPYVLSGLANCRYPFIIARCLGVGVPTVAKVVPGRRWWSVHSGRFGARRAAAYGNDGKPPSAGGVALASLDADADAADVRDLVGGGDAEEMAIPNNNSVDRHSDRSRATSAGSGDGSDRVASVSLSASSKDEDGMIDAFKSAPLSGAFPPSSTDSAVSLPSLPLRPIGATIDNDGDDEILKDDSDDDSAALLRSAASSQNSDQYSALEAAFDEEDFEDHAHSDAFVSQFHSPHTSMRIKYDANALLQCLLHVYT